ncbi:MAG: bacillithiol system redox-active protein YtxJ [Flavobacteriaceae bacterium]|nr:bacillithiol system redox-active protein YtxJ [Flavobacteriaceae bacterium]
MRIHSKEDFLSVFDKIVSHFDNMSWFFKKKKKESEYLNDLHKEYIKLSYQRPQVLFKHSHKCGTSTWVLREFNEMLEGVDCSFDFVLINVFDKRPLSNELSRVLDIPHQSPQVLVLKNGKVTDHASHGHILQLNITHLLC